MLRDLIFNLKYTYPVALFFLAWPLVVSLLLSPKGRLQWAPRKFWSSLQFCLASYAGLAESGSANASWFILLHRLVGSLAWAYALAVFIKSIE